MNENTHKKHTISTQYSPVLSYVFPILYSKATPHEMHKINTKYSRVFPNVYTIREPLSGP